MENELAFIKFDFYLIYVWSCDWFSYSSQMYLIYIKTSKI